MEERTGQCMCGAVRFTARLDPAKAHVCHCPQCRRWAGSAFFGVTVAKGDMTIEDASAVRTFRSSDWASRSSCGTCGSTLWYRFDQGEDGAGDYELAVGLLDDANGLVMEREIFADERPDCWALVGDHPRLSRKETLAEFGMDG